MKKFSLKRIPYFAVALAAMLVMSCSDSDPEVTVVSPDNNQQQQGDTDNDTDEGSNIEEIPGTIRDMSSFDLVAEMRVGWNLGNSFDVRSRDKTLWGNPLSTPEMIDAVRELGFETIRIPVTWDYNLAEDAPYELEVDYLDRVQIIVNAAIENGMHVILNTHHEDEWAGPVPANFDEVAPRLSSLWTQVAERFRNYGDVLIFETLNEPRVVGSPGEWLGGTPQERAILNELHQVSLDAIRATGGNNANRHIMISTYAAGTVQEAMDDLVIPNDDPNIIISIHTYFPFTFALEGTEPWGTESDREELRQELDRVRDHWIVGQQRPVILGEWGALSGNDLDQRLDYAEFYVTEALERGMLPVVWDDGGDFILFNRFNLFWPNLQVAETILEAGGN